jgi:hypothetical protein
MKLRPPTSPSRKLITTPRQRFKWIVRFAGLDLAALGRGDLWNVQEELSDFLLPLHTSIAPGGVHVWPDIDPRPEQYSLVELQALQAELRDELSLAVASRADNSVLPYRALPSLRYAAPHVPALPYAAPGHHFWSVKGSVRDLVLLLFYHLLASQNTAALALCPECDRIFLRQTNQRYCGKPCANKVAQRLWRERQATATIAEPPLLPTTQRAQ